MSVDGFKLPEAFVALIERPKPFIHWLAKGDPEDWIYKGGEGGLYWIPRGDAECDASLPDLDLFKSLAEVEEQTKRLPMTMHVADYLPEEIAKGDAREAHLPGFLPFITDFSKIAHFGDDGTGAPYCFDYRENADEPGIIHWNDAYWRRFAPNFDSFISLFEVRALVHFRYWRWPFTPETREKPLPEELRGRKSLRLDRPMVRKVAQWSREQEEEKPLNLLFATVKRGWLYLFAIDTRADMLALEEQFDQLVREIEEE